MSRFVIFLFCIFVSDISFASDVKFSSVLKFPVEKLVLKSGLNVLFISRTDSPVVDLEISFKRSGYAYDPSSKYGIAYFVSKLMDEGVGDDDAAQFSKRLMAMGARIGHSVDKDCFTISLRVLVKNFESALELLIKSIFSLRIDDGTMARVKSMHVADLHRAMENPSFVALDRIYNVLYASHPYSNSIFGTEEIVSNFTGSDVTSYVKSSFNVVNAFISVVGGVKKDVLVRVLNKVVAGFPILVGDVRNLPDFQIQNSENVQKDFFFEVDSPQNVICFARTGVSIGDKNHYNSVMLNYILGGGSLGSMLMSALRGDKGLTYRVKTEMIHNNSSDVFVGTVFTASETSSEVVATIKKVLKEAVNNGIDIKRFETARNNVVSSFILNLETSSQMINMLSYVQRNSLPFSYVENYMRNVEDVSLDDLNHFTREFLNLNDFFFVEVGRKVGT